MAATAVSCGRRSPAIVIPPLPVVKIEDVAAPEKTEVVVVRGSNLQTIAFAAYGHEDFSGFVASLNGLRDPALVMAGAKLRTPSLAIGLRDAGLDARYQPAVNVLAKTWADVKAFLPEYEKQRYGSEVRDGGTFPISAALSREMRRCADAIDAAVAVLEKPASGHKVPTSTIGKFAGCSGDLRLYAEGRAGSNDYDVFMLQKGFGQGFTYALIWAQAGHQ